MSNPNLQREFLVTGQGNPAESFQPLISDVAGIPGRSTGQEQRGKNKRLKGVTAGHHPVDLAGGASKPRCRRKPDPSASTAAVTAPCSECGRRFWSHKALFGHMRCHPERQWRGVNPPPHVIRRPHPTSSDVPPPPTPHPTPPHLRLRDMEMEHEVATCLVMMANGPATPLSSRQSCRFQCSSCKKVFGSHQALGGHRASHRNVKGCFAMARNEGEESSSSGAVSCGNNEGGDDGRRAAEMGSEHRCQVCRRAFPSGQALGGHKRCHWERGDEQDAGAAPAPRGHVPDLNLPPPLENGGSSSEPVLDLKLGVCAWEHT